MPVDPHADVPLDLLVGASLVYVAILFGVAFHVERRAAAGGVRWLRSPLVYTLSLSVYCTAWTFYGAVGYAARSGLEYLTIYLGPTLVFTGWWALLRKLVRIGRQSRATSIADLVAARYGKSTLLGAIVTLIAVVTSTPYIALQLQSVTLSVGVFAGSGDGLSDRNGVALWVAVGLAAFTILFGTRNLDANEQHTGVVTAIALEAVVKLAAVLAVGIFVVWGLADGPGDILARIEASALSTWTIAPGRWTGLIFLSAAAVLCLPRMFQVMVVENADERHLATASWAFPAYLMGMSLFVVPVAVMGLARMPAGSNPDLFMLTLPLREGRGDLAMLAFLGGFSSATSMVIVAAIALSTMVSNHIVMPVWLRLRAAPALSGDGRRVILLSRRLAIAGVLALGYGYYRFSGGTTALAAIGLISFVGAAQILPAMLGGLYWRGASRTGAALGLVAGFAVWAWTLFLPSFGTGGLLSAAVMAQGPWGIGWLRPQALFGIAMEPLNHAMLWSLSLNGAVFCAASLLSFPGPVERVQSAAFVNVFDGVGAGPRNWARGQAEAEDLLVMAQRILGDDETLAFFAAEARAQGSAGYLPEPVPAFVDALERRLAGSVGSAAAHAMVAQVAGRAAVSVEDLIAVANESAQIMENATRLEEQRGELMRTARALREANAKLTALAAQKDAFLSQISHELRTPMTSIRAFSEILAEGGMEGPDVARYGGIIHAEAQRLTRLLDDLLDLAVLESGSVTLAPGLVNLRDLIERALVSASHARPDRDLAVRRDPASEDLFVRTDGDRLTQVFINLISNARKYCAADAPELAIVVGQRAGRVTVDFVDNGTGIAKEKQALIFEKFVRLGDGGDAGGAGLGLVICREVLARLGGTVDYLPRREGTAFRVTLPLRIRQAA